MRKMLWILYILTVFVLKHIDGFSSKQYPGGSKTYSTEKNLVRMLLDRYEQHGVIGRPVEDSKIQVTVEYGLQLFQILKLEENKQILHTICWCVYNWQDSLLRWNESQYNNISVLSVPAKYIWTPDIKLYNFADERLIEKRDARVVVSSDGGALWVPQAMFKSTCEVEISSFPFDKQVCTLRFGSWTYDKTQMELRFWRKSGPGTDEIPYVDYADYIPSNEWHTDGELEKDHKSSNRTHQALSFKNYAKRKQYFGDEFREREFPTLNYIITLKRNPSFYIFMLVIPCVLLSIMTTVVFWLPPESPAKMMLGMNIFVAFFVLLILLANSTPSAVQNFPFIGIFFCLNMIMITLSTFLATLIIHLHFRGDRSGPVPRFLRRFVIEGIGRLVYVRQQIPLPPMKKPTLLPQFSTGKSRKHNSTTNSLLPNDGNYCAYHAEAQYAANPQGPFPKSKILEEKTHRFGCNGPGCRQAEFTTPLPGTLNQRYFTQPNTSDQQPVSINNTYLTDLSANLRSSREKLTKKTQPKMNEQDNIASLLTSSEDLEHDVREVRRYIKLFVNRQKEIARKGIVSMEWRTLALVLDRLFFFLYIATIAIVVIATIPK